MHKQDPCLPWHVIRQFLATRKVPAVNVPQATTGQNPGLAHLETKEPCKNPLISIHSDFWVSVVARDGV